VDSVLVRHILERVRSDNRRVPYSQGTLERVRSDNRWVPYW
jgi:hypothetical protein